SQGHDALALKTTAPDRRAIFPAAWISQPMKLDLIARAKLGPTWLLPRNVLLLSTS
ncbi:MAG: hypothetical protein ACI9XK_001921, partial [Granulosicoccus sp.]